jgi:hypothetical protein
VTLLEFTEEQMALHGIERRDLKQACKVSRKRCEVLRLRYERRHAVVADDILEEPLTVTWKQFLSIFRGETCVRCWKFKAPDNAFCLACFAKLDGPTCAAFRKAATIHYGFCRAMRLFQIPFVQCTGEMEGMLGWPGQPHPPREPLAQA